jgi:hypothetical protein
MDAVIKTRFSELDSTLNRIKAFLQGDEDAEITISIQTPKRHNDFYKNLGNAIQDVENEHNVVTFSMDEFMNFSDKLIEDKAK